VAPGVGARVCGPLRYRSKLPRLGSCARIESARSAGISVGSDDQKVLIDNGRRVVRYDHIDLAVLAERRYRFSGERIDGDKTLSGGEEDARRKVCFAGPKRNAAPGRFAALQFIAPDFLACF